MSANVAALPAGKGQFSLAPQSLEEAMRFADVLSKSSIVPKDYQGNPGNVLVAVQWGAEIGLPPLQAMQNIAVINGRPAIWGDAMLALVRGSGLLEYIKEEPGDTGCTCTVKRKGDPDEAVRTFTLEDAKKAGLAGKPGPWQQMPRRMMQLRARAFALRDVFPDVLRGVHIAEEVQGMPAEKDMGQADVVPGEQAKPSRADRARAALSHRQDEVPAVTLPSVLDAIGKAGTEDDLARAGELAAKLQADADKKEARRAFGARKKAIAAGTAATVDPETGEVLSGGTGVDYEKVAASLRAATSIDTLDVAADLIQDVGHPEDQDDLRLIYKQRRDELTAKTA